MSDNYQHTRLKALANESISTIEAPYDLRKYLVKDDNENVLGYVSDLLFDIQSRKVRYLIIELQENKTAPQLRKILAPIGTVDLGPDTNSVTISSLTEELISALPDYIEGKVNPGVENIVRLAYAGESIDFEGAGLTGNNGLNEEELFYNHFHFGFSKLYWKKNFSDRRTVNGVFDDGLEAENAITELMSNGFSQDDIELSSSMHAKDETGVEGASLNLEATKGGSVVTVITNNPEEALKASEIFDKSGCVSVYEHKD